jgi:hypothetical protein
MLHNLSLQQKRLMIFDRSLGGVMVVTAIRPKVRVFKPGRGDRILREIKIRRTPSFGGEVTPEVPCREILRRVKTTSKYEQRYFEGQINHFLRQVFPDLLLDDCS